jgi:hypothetical protein
MAVTLSRSSRQDTFTANCPSGALVGDMVYISGDQIGGFYQVGLCDIREDNKRTVGMIVEKQSPTQCTVQKSGDVTNLYSGLTPGRQIFLGLGTGARLTQIVPNYSPKVYIERAGIALASNVIDLHIEPATVRVST